MEYQRNGITLLPYEGRNQVELIRTKEANNYKSSFWVTFLRAKQMGRQIKTGESGVRIIKVVSNTYTDDNGQVKNRSGIKSYIVFNLDQTTGGEVFNPVIPESVKAVEFLFH